MKHSLMVWRNPRCSQRGFALVTALLFLLIITGLSVSMYRSFDAQGQIAGNTMEKQRAQQAAESALRYGEWLVQQSELLVSDSCTSVIDANTGTPVVCSQPLLAPETLPWSGRMDYTPPSMTVAPGGGLVSSSGGIAGDINYIARPSVYIAEAGKALDGGRLYRLTAAGYGGSPSSASVVQSTYSLAGGVICGDCP